MILTFSEPPPRECFTRLFHDFFLPVHSGAQVFLSKLVSAQILCAFLPTTLCPSSLRLKISPPARRNSRALHQTCAIRIIVLNFAELTPAQPLLSTRLSTFMCKTSSHRNNSYCTSALFVLQLRPFLF